MINTWVLPRPLLFKETDTSSTYLITSASEWRQRFSLRDSASYKDMAGECSTPSAGYKPLYPQHYEGRSYLSRCSTSGCMLIGPLVCTSPPSLSIFHELIIHHARCSHLYIHFTTELNLHLHFILSTSFLRRPCIFHELITHNVATQLCRSTYPDLPFTSTLSTSCALY